MIVAPRGRRPRSFAVITVLTLVAGSFGSVAAQELPAGISALPELVEFVDAAYPPEAFAAAVQADVLVQITIDESGHVSAAVPTAVVLYSFDENGAVIEQTVTADADPWGFTPVALAALEGFVFEPALDDEGNPVAVGLVWRYGFYLEEEVVTEVPPGQETPLDPGVAPVNLSGELIERGTRAPIAGAEVFATREGELASTVTDAAGRFGFRGLAAGTWLVESELAGYQALRQSEDIALGERTEVSYYVEREDYGEYTSEVRAEAVRREVSRQTLSVTEVNRVPGNNGDAIKVIQSLPGFARSPFNGGLIVIRGSAPEDSRIFVEGVWIPVIFHFGGLTSVVNSDLLAELEYLPGAFSVEYGRATGGVINVETRRPRSDGYHGYVDFDVFDAGVLIEGPIAQDWSFFASARRSYIDAILPAVFPDDAGLSLTVAPRYWDYQVKLQWDPAREHSLNLLFFGSDDELAFLVEEPPGDPAIRGNIDTSTGFHRVRLEWLAEVSDELTNRFIVSGGFQDLDFVAGEDLFFLLDTVPFTVRDTLEWRVRDNLRLRPGIDLEYNLFDIGVSAPRPTKEGEVPVTLGAAEIVATRIQAAIFEPAAFFEAEWDVVDNWTVVPGVRLEYYNTVDEFAFDARLNTRWDFADAWTLKGSVGTFHQTPLPDETDDIFGNPDLGLELALHYVVGLEYAFTEYLDLDFQLFYKDLRELVTRSDEVVERDGESVPEIYNNEGEGRVFGGEVLFRHRLANHFFGWVSYTLSRSERQDEVGGEYRLFSWDQTHNLSVVASYELGANWAIGARFRFVTGNPQTPIVGSVFDADGDVFVRSPGEVRSARVPPFHSLDLRVDKRFVFDNWILEVYLDVSNAYNRANPEGINYNFDFSQSQRLTGLPIIPSLGMRGSF